MPSTETRLLGLHNLEDLAVSSAAPSGEQAEHHPVALELTYPLESAA